MQNHELGTHDDEKRYLDYVQNSSQFVRPICQLGQNILCENSESMFAKLTHSTTPPIRIDLVKIWTISHIFVGMHNRGPNFEKNVLSSKEVCKRGRGLSAAI